MLRTGEHTRVGIDPGADAFRAVAVASGRIAAAVEVPVREGVVSRVDAARRAFAALERQGIARPRSCVAVVPTASMVNAVLELPPRASGAPLEDLAAAELSRGMDGSGVEVGVFTIREQAEQASECLVTGAIRDDVMSIVETMSRLGVTVDAIDAPVCALSRACSAQNHLIVEVEQEGLVMHAIHRGGPVLSRSVQSGPGATSGETLVAEIDRCAAYLASYKYETAIEQVVLTGQDARAPHLTAAITEAFEIDVVCWDGTQWDPGQPPCDPVFARALGAAAWGTPGRAAA